MLQTITTILNAILEMLPNIGGSGTIANVIKMLVALLPVIIQGYQELLPIVQNIIATLSQKDDITDDQIKQLQQMSAAIDSHFAATAAKARADDALAAATAA